jgi:hypothetical protein
VRKFFPTYDKPTDTGPELPGLPYPPPGGAINDVDVLEIPLAIQDRVFERDGKLWYPQVWILMSMLWEVGAPGGGGVPSAGLLCTHSLRDAVVCCLDAAVHVHLPLPALAVSLLGLVCQPNVLSSGWGWELYLNFTNQCST